MRFYNYLVEKGQMGRDDDYVQGGNTVVIFDKNDEYKRSGKTHGLKSHAIKHGMEFNSDSYNNYLYKMKKYVENVDFYILNSKGKIISSEITKGVSDKMLINTMDRINDKIVKNMSLTDEEKGIDQNIIEPIEKEYYNEYIKFENNSIDVTDMDISDVKKLLNKILKVKVDGKEIIFNLKELIFAIKEKTGYPSTFFKINNKEKLVRKLKQFSKDNILQDIINNL